MVSCPAVSSPASYLQSITCKIGNKFFILLPGTHALCTFFNNVNNQLINNPVQILNNLFLTHMTVNIKYKRLVFFYGLKNIQKSLFPCIICSISICCYAGILLTGPFNEVINIFEMIIKKVARLTPQSSVISLIVILVTGFFSNIFLRDASNALFVISDTYQSLLFCISFHSFEKYYTKLAYFPQ